MDFPEWGGMGRKMRLELKLGINKGKDSAHVMLGRLDERMSEMKGG